MIGLENTPEAVPLQQIGNSLHTGHRKIGILAGSENLGIRDHLIKLCDVVAKIPMYGKLHSHNVHVSIAIGLYEITRTLRT
ncbi:MAG: hypothetical protein N3F09_08705 [Bacteroidia bacterium]|nr:hypothetical protein [Bacteroidia bacterium]